MLNKNKSSGMVLAMVLMCLSIMSVLVYGISQMTSNQQRSASNYVDMKLAEYYTRVAMFEAESTVYKFDMDNELESPPISCNDAVNQLKAISGKDSSYYVGASCLSLRRGWRLNKLADGSSLITTGAECEKGICFNNSLSVGNNADVTFNSDLAWRPWLKSSFESIIYEIKDKNLSQSPRYIIEPINMDFRGNFHIRTEDEGNYESDMLTQKNNAAITLYELDESKNIAYNETIEAPPPLIPSARLYRITVLGFGKNSDTRMTLQEIIAVSDFSTNQFEHRESDDTKENFAYRMQRIATYWIR